MALLTKETAVPTNEEHGHVSDDSKVKPEKDDPCVPFYNDFERKLVTDHIAKWPDKGPHDIQSLLLRIYEGKGLVLRSNTLDLLYSTNPAAGTWLLVYLLKIAKINILLHLQKKEHQVTNLICNIRDSSYLGYPAQHFGLTKHCKVVNFKLWIDTTKFPKECGIDKKRCILDFDMTESGRIIKVFACLASDD